MYGPVLAKLLYLGLLILIDKCNTEITQLITLFYLMNYMISIEINGDYVSDEVYKGFV